MTFEADLDQPELDRIAAEAWSRAVVLAALHLSRTWPELPASIPPDLATDVRRFGTELYFYGLLFAAMSAEASAGLNGVTLAFPALALTEGYPETRRLLSYETMLDEMTADEAKTLAARFRGLAGLLEGIGGES